MKPLFCSHLDQTGSRQAKSKFVLMSQILHSKFNNIGLFPQN